VVHLLGLEAVMLLILPGVGDEVVGWDGDGVDWYDIIGIVGRLAERHFVRSA
jgi:hypothetical protein